MNVGIIGYGYWGPNLVRNFSSTPGAKVVKVADARPERLRAVTGQYPAVQTTQDAAALINDPGVDAVVIATPVHTHFALAKAALEAGKHVLVEKPLTSTVQDAEEMIELAKKKNRLLMVDHTYLYTPAVRKIKQLVVEGVLGAIHYFDSTRINLGLFQPDVNVLWDLAVHDISILNYLTHERPKSVQAIGVSHTGQGIENIAYLSMRYESGLIAHFNCSWSSPVKIRHILIGGDKKMVLFDDLQPSEKVKLYDTGYSVRTDEEKRRLLVDYRAGDIFIPQLDKTEALSAMARDFVESIANGRQPVASAESGLDVIKVLAAAQISIKESGREVML